MRRMLNCQTKKGSKVSQEERMNRHKKYVVEKRPRCTQGTDIEGSGDAGQQVMVTLKRRAGLGMEDATHYGTELCFHAEHTQL